MQWGSEFPAAAALFSVPTMRNAGLPCVLAALWGATLVAQQTLYGQSGPLGSGTALSGTWGAVDGLGRVLPGHEVAGSPRAGRTVIMFYFQWHGAHGYDHHRQPPPNGGVWPKEAHDYASPFDLTKILAAAGPGKAPAYGPEHAFHYWGEPHLGYYLSDDEAVLRRHALWLVDAGVDAIALDVTNALTYSANYQRLMDVYAAMRREGTPTPQVLFLAYAGARQVTDTLWRELYEPRKHEELWFRWCGKPLLLAPADGVDPAHREFFSLRRSWAWSAGEWFGDGRDAWPWLDHFPQRAGWHEDPKRPEALAVAVAQHPTTNIGRSFHAGAQPPLAQQEPAQGLCFAEQWRRALEVDPEVVFVTGWNEWTAMRFLSDGHATMCGRELAAGESFFVDQYSQEFSRDIEPMRGGHEDAYYWQLVDGIRRFKGVPPSPEVSAPTTIEVGAPGSAWEAVKPAFLDHRGDDFGRDHAGFGAAGPYRQSAAPNDLLLAKVARDETHITFLVRAAKALIVAPDARDAMLLFVDADCDPKTGWNGFDFVFGGRGHHDGTTSIERIGPGFADRKLLGSVPTHRAGTDFTLRVSRDQLGLQGKPAAFDFQWVDGVGNTSNRVEWLDHGDSAPDARFVYRYRPQ